MNGPTPSREPTVLDSAGHVLYDPESAGAARPTGGYTVSWGTTAGTSFRSMSVLPKLFFVAAFLSLFTIGLAFAAVALAAFFFGWAIRALFRTRRI